MPLRKKIAVLVIVFGLSGILSYGAFAQNAENTSDITALFGSSYKAEKTVTKKVFAKALAALLKLPSSKDKTCFKDLKKNDAAWASICALKKARVFSGTKKTAFSPSAKVTFDFAIITLCKAQNWTTKKTKTACSAYAKKQGFWKTPLPTKINGAKPITFLQLAHLMKRGSRSGSIEGGDSGNVSELPAAMSDNTEPRERSQNSSVAKSTIPPRISQNSPGTPLVEQPISKTFFSNIVLAEDMPNRFFADEIYFVEGELANISAEEVFVFLCKDGQGCDNSTNFLEKTNGTRFRIPVHFKETGNFQLGIIAGRAGQSKVVNISVMPDPPSPTGGQAATTLEVKYNKGETIFSWDGGDTITRLIVFQNTKRKDYIFRQGTKEFSPSAEDFEDFNEGEAKWLVQQGAAQSAIQNIELVVQDFRKIEDDDIEIKTFPEVFGEKGHFVFKGKARKTLSKKAAFTRPDGSVKEFDIAPGDIASGKDFTVEFELDDCGTYIFEINNPEGSAIVNAPIYVCTGLPILPDYIALNQTEPDKTPILNLDEARKKLLDLINKDRSDNDLSPIKASSLIHNIAQPHSANMVNLNFFGHVDPSGRSPDDRRKAAGYSASIRENLGKASTLELVEYGLMRSPVHRDAILDPKMKLVGLGIAKDSEGYFLVTQNFSEEPIESDDLLRIENELFSAANIFRASQGLAGLSNDSTRRTVASTWSKRMAQEDFFSPTAPNGETLINAARASGINSSIQVNIVQSSSVEKLEEELLDQVGLKNNANIKIGIGLGVNALGEVYMTVLYTP